jgi:hypothetical protein
MINVTVPWFTVPAGEVIVAVSVTACDAFENVTTALDAIVLVADNCTCTLPLVPSIAAFPVSIAVIVWLPAILKVALNVPVPLVNVLSAGRMAFPSLVVKWTVRV